MNQGLVDADGHWHPIYSTGCDGIDQDEWFERKINALKDELGYAYTSVNVQHQEAKHRAIEEIFHKKWFEVSGDPDDYPEVKKLLEKEENRYAAWISGRDAYRLEKTHRLDAMFMQALEREFERDRPSEIGLIDDKHIKETCRKFCESYKGNVGMMANCLDKMSKLGYASWCTCSDCGKQFQPRDYEELSCSIDSESYHGDGGIGVIMTRILCDECHSAVECPKCYNLNLPNPYVKEGRDYWDMYDLLACILHDWLGVCWACADGFRYDEAFDGREDEHTKKCEGGVGETYKRVAERLEELHGLQGHALYERLLKTMSGRKIVNRIRNLLRDAVREHFGQDMDDDRIDDVLSLDAPGQGVLPGFEH